MAWEICRVCLQGGELVSLFDCDENNEVLSNKYTSCSSIVVSEDDHLPCLICLICVDKLMSAFQFRQQCILSNETLSECISEFRQTSGILQTRQSGPSTGSETIRIKRENGSYLEYEIPVEQDAGRHWPKAQESFLLPHHFMAQRTPGQKKKPRGRNARKHVDEFNEIPLTANTKHKEAENRKVPVITLTDVLKSGSRKSKEKEFVYDVDLDRPGVLADENGGHSDDDPDYFPEADDNHVSEAESEPMLLSPKTGLLVSKGGRKKGKKGGSKRKIKDEKDDDDEEDVLLKETIMANSAPIPINLLSSEKKDKKKKKQKRRYQSSKTHTCDQCGASFKSNSSLQGHIRRHLGIKPFVCTICGYACVMNMELRRHMIRHTGLRPYQCRICDRRFGDCGSRQKHERLHLGERPYQCQLCEKTFTYSSVLANHMLTHTGEKKYGCEPCNKRFTKAHHLKYHNKLHHKEIYLKQEEEAQNKKMRNQLMMNIAQQCSKQLLGMITDDGQAVQLLKTMRDEKNEEQNINQEEHTDETELTDEMEHAGEVIVEEMERDIDQDSEQHSMQIEEDIEIEEGKIMYHSEDEV